jgi:hypothetical protein
MRPFLFFCCLFLLSKTNAQNSPLFEKNIPLPGLSDSSSLVLQVDTISASKTKVLLNYKAKGPEGTVEVNCVDSSFAASYSAWELKEKLNTLVTDCLLKKLPDDSPDKDVIKNNLPVVIGFARDDWYEAVQGKLKAKKESKLQSNVIDLSYNDSLTALLNAQCRIRVYRPAVEILTEKKDSSVKDHKLNVATENDYAYKVNKFYASIPVKNVRVQVNDGFIYSFSFDIDTADVPEMLKRDIRVHQAFAIRYNLRHNILTQVLMDDKDGVPLKKIHANLKNSNSDYIFYAGEFFNYQSPLAAVTTIFTARDTIINLSNCTQQVARDTVKLKEKSLYSILNLDVFGDLVGFFENSKPNGLIQTELKANFYGFRRPLSQKYTTTARFTPFNKGELFFRLSKLDDKNRFLPVLTDSVKNRPGGLSDTITKYVHGYRLLEYQNIYAGLRFNVGEFEFRGGSLAFTNEVSFLRTPLKDTIFITQEKQGRIDTFPSPVNYGKNSLILAPGLQLKLLAASFCDIDLRGRIFFIHPLTKKIGLTTTEYDEFYGGNSYKSQITSKLYNFGVQFTVNLNNDKSRRIIIRGDTYIDTKTRGNNFWQAQVGYSADLNKFISLNNPAQNK